jgi:hypothetical protein
MAFFPERKACSTTKECKQTAATNCEGCSQAFCTKHLIEHRRTLGEEMNVIVSEQNQLQQTFNEQPTEPDSHPFMKRIDDWEKESIAKIQQKAKDLRLELIQLTTVRKNELSKKLRQMSEQLYESREHDNFIEIDLQQWKNTLKDLRSMLDLSSMFSFEESDNSPLLKNISLMFTIENELFEQVFDNTVQIKQSGYIAIHDTSYNYTEIRGKNEYTSGHHRIRLLIEQSADSWTFLGINSKSTPLKKQSCNAKSAYGWTNNNYIWLRGECLPNTSASRIQMKTNDVISLIFNCDKRKISMINERTNAKHELDVNIDHCPFPWQLHLNLYEANSCVRILSA